MLTEKVYPLGLTIFQSKIFHSTSFTQTKYASTSEYHFFWRDGKDVFEQAVSLTVPLKVQTESNMNLATILISLYSNNTTYVAKSYAKDFPPCIVNNYFACTIIC